MMRCGCRQRDAGEAREGAEHDQHGRVSRSMIRRKPAPDVIRGRHRFADKVIPS
jgi:hypothetical protein